MTREELEQMKQEEPNSMSPRYEYIKGWNDAIDAVEENEPKQGEWKQITAKDGEYYCYHKCTNCGQTIESGFDNPPLFNFCPNCGARMTH